MKCPSPLLRPAKRKPLCKGELLFFTITAIAYDNQNDNPLIIHKNTSRNVHDKINSSPYALQL